MTNRTHISLPIDEKNVEIKARIGSEQEFERRMPVACEPTKSSCELLEQKDVPFNLLEEIDGRRLKLLYLQPPDASQLIYYVRPNKTGPKLSTFNRIDVEDPVLLQEILKKVMELKEF